MMTPWLSGSDERSNNGSDDFVDINGDDVDDEFIVMMVLVVVVMKTIWNSITACGIDRKVMYI